MKCWHNPARMLPLAALVLLPALAAAGVLSRTELQTYSVAGIEVLNVRNGSGTLEILGEDREDIRVELTIKAGGRSRDKARAQLAQAELKMSRDGAELLLRPRLPDGKIWMDILLRVPRHLALTARSGSGDLRVREIAGLVKLQAGSGDIEAKRLGGEVEIRGSSGAIRVREVTGALSVEGGSGTVSLNRLVSDCELKLVSGDAEIRGVGGDLRVKTRSGDLVVRNVDGSAELEASSGDVTVAGVDGDLQVRSSSGDQKLRGVGRPGRDLILICASGDVDLRILRDAAFEIRLETSSGDVEIQIPLEVSKISRQRLHACLGTGGGRMRIETSSGDIRIRYMEERK